MYTTIDHQTQDHFPDTFRRNTPPTACFSIHAEVEPSVMPRVLELFAKRGLVPNRWYSDISHTPSSELNPELVIDLQVENVQPDLTDKIASSLRQIISVKQVTTSEKTVVF